MRRVLLAGVLVLGLGACSDPADSQECKQWQSRYEGTHQFDDSAGALLRAGLLEKRPEGCPIP